MRLMRNFLYNIKQKIVGERKNNYILNTYQPKISYSQMGEDLIVRFIFNAIGISHPSYLDIGAYDPYEISNTALFYLDGSRGVNVEPDVEHFKKFLQERKEDVNLNIGVADHPGELKFFKMSAPSLNTFSESEANEFVEEHGFKIISTNLINVDTIPNIIQNNCFGVFPHFLSLDAEGLDINILKSIDFKSNSPLVICTETLSYSEKGIGIKNLDIPKFLESKGYMVFADTYINSIFVKKDFWIREKRNQ